MMGAVVGSEGAVGAELVVVTIGMRSGGGGGGMGRGGRAMKDSFGAWSWTTSG